MFYMAKLVEPSQQACEVLTIVPILQMNRGTDVEEEAGVWNPGLSASSIHTLCTTFPPLHLALGTC